MINRQPSRWQIPNESQQDAKRLTAFNDGLGIALGTSQIIQMLVNGLRQRYSPLWGRYGLTHLAFDDLVTPA